MISIRNARIQTMEAMIAEMPCIQKITHVLTTEYTAHEHMHMENRPWYGISLAIDGKIVYKHNGHRYISDNSHIVILPKNQSYELECLQSGKFTLINFLLDADIALDHFQIIEISNPKIIFTLHKKIETIFLSCQSSKYARTLSCFYEIIALIIEEKETKCGTFDFLFWFLQFKRFKMRMPTEFLISKIGRDNFINGVFFWTTKLYIHYLLSVL